MKKIVASEFVSWGHPDKMADQVSDAILDEFLKHDPHTRAGIEVLVKDNIVVLGGEINSGGKIDYDETVRKVFRNLPFPDNHHLRPDNIKIINLIGKQSQEIHAGVDKSDAIIGAGDQGFCVGFASNETACYLPLGVYVAKYICQFISQQTALQFGPDTKSQVIVEYENDKAIIPYILVSTMQQNDLEADRVIIHEMIRNNRMGMDEMVFNQFILDKNIKIDINPCGSWRTGGPVSDCGVTGRKIVVDQFGGYSNVGGGNLHGKDMSKIDRSAAYVSRYLAKNIVAAGISDTAKVELSYAISVPEPTSINIELNKHPEMVEKMKEWIKKNVDLTPHGIIKRFDGSYPRYYNTAVNGHYGSYIPNRQVADFYKMYPWEKTDLLEDLKRL